MTAAAMDHLKVPPHSMQAEQSVLGGLMLDASAFAKVSPLLAESDFFANRHRFIYRAIAYLHGRGEPVDVVTVADFLDSRGHKEAVDLAYLGLLAKETPSAANVATYAKIVRDKSLLREAHALFAGLAARALNSGETDAQSVLTEAQDAVFRLNQAALKGRKAFQRLGDVLAEQVDVIEALHEKPPTDGVLGISTGFAELDKMMGGLQGGDLVVVAARPSMGKTSLAMNFAENAALTGKAAAVFSLEMTAAQLAQRMLAGSAGLPIRCIREPWTIYDDAWPKLTQGLARLDGIPLWINDSAGLTAADVRALCMRLDSQVREECPEGIRLVVVDYLQLMAFDGKPGTRNEGLGDITRALKQLAKEFGAPVVLLSQLNRDCDKRPDKRPHLADLRDSGAIEQDADVVLFVYRDERYNEESFDKGMAEIIFAKQRNSGLGTVRLGFDGYLTRFRNL